MRVTSIRPYLWSPQVEYSSQIMVNSNATTQEVFDYLTRDLASNNHYIGGAHVPPNPDPTEWAVFTEVEVTEATDGAVAIKYIQGPGFFASGEDLLDLAQKAVDRGQRSLPALAGRTVRVSVGPKTTIPDEWLDEVRRVAREFLVDNQGFVSEIGETAPQTWAVLVYPLVSVVGDSALEIAWAEGPGFSRLDPDQGAEGLTEGVIPLIEAAVPGLKGYDFVLEYADD